MTKPNIGYLLPDGEAYTADLACMMLFYPDKPEYRRALFGALDYFGTWLAWERDDDKRGKDAAKAWAEATVLTRKCMSMNTCETIIDLLTEIRDKPIQCCGESTHITYGDNIIVTTTIVPDVGAYPTDWGEQEVDDWDDWKEYVCYQAHLFVDDLIDTAAKLDTAATIGGYVLDFVAHLFSIVQWRMVEDLIPVNFSMIAAIVDALGQAGIQNEFETIQATIEDAREEIVCALILGDSLEDAVELAIDNELAWTVFFSWIDYETTTGAIYTGEAGEGGYLPVGQRDDCTCAKTPTEGDIMAFSFTIDLTGDAWDEGLGPADPIHFEIGEPFSGGGSPDIIRDGRGDGPSTGGEQKITTWHASDAPEGYDDEPSHSYRSFDAAEWIEIDDYLYLWTNTTEPATGTFTLSNLRIFADVGDGYQWYAGEFSWINQNDYDHWSYDEDAQEIVGEWDNDEGQERWIRIQIVALV